MHIAKYRGRSKQWDAVDGVCKHALKSRNTVYFEVYYVMIVALWHMPPHLVDTLVIKLFITQHSVMFRNIWNRQHHCGNVESWKCIYFSNTENIQSIICDYCFVA